MIFRNIDFHNVEELAKGEKGYAMLRVPSPLREQLNTDAAQKACFYSTGVELRFKILSGSATVTLRADQNEEAQVAYLYYGAFQGGFPNSSRVILPQETRITIPAPEHLEQLKQITKEQKLGFNPEVVRVVLPYGTCYFADVEGEVVPPSEQDVPSFTYLAYGSSITHGSLALAAPYTYPFQIAQRFHCDYLNLGFAGSARMEKSMAEYLVSRKDWNFASVEMGINMIGDDFTEEIFEERIRRFVDVLAADPRPVFATSLFGFVGQNQAKGTRYREIVRRITKDRLIFTNGLELLDNPAFISQDLTHPTLEGIGQIASRWYDIMKTSAVHSGVNL